MPRPHAPSWVRHFTWCHHSRRQTKEQVASHANALYAQGNILITRDGQTCLGDFGIAGAFRGFSYEDHKLKTLRYMAPERLSEEALCVDNLPVTIDGPSKASDVYSLAVTSFEVRSLPA